MLQELLMDLVTAADPKDKEKAYRRLERIGVDRLTAKVLEKEFQEGGELYDLRTDRA